MRKLKHLLIALFALVLTAGAGLGAAGLDNASVTAKANGELTEVTVTYDSIALDRNLFGLKTSAAWTEHGNGAVQQTGVIINGVEREVETCRWGDADIVYFSIGTADVPEGKTISFKIPAGTVLDKVVVKEDTIFNVSGNGNVVSGVTEVVGEVESAVQQDGASRYLVYVKANKTVADDAWNNNKFLIDGVETTINVAPSGDSYLVLLPYSLFGEGITSCSQIEEEHVFVIPAGTGFGSIVVTNEIKLYIYKDSLKATSHFTKVNVTALGDCARQNDGDGNPWRWFIRLTTDVTLDGAAFENLYGDLTIKVGGEEKTLTAYQSDMGGIVFLDAFGAIPADFEGKIVIPAGAKTTGGQSGILVFEKEYTFIIHDLAVKEYKIYTATLNYDGAKIGEVTYDVFDRAAKLETLKNYAATIPAVEHYEFAIENLPDVLPEENCEYNVIKVPLKYKVTFDGENETSVAYGEKIQKPADPTKESTVSTVYTFDGWYNGETKWNFETDTVSGDVALIAKYTESDRKYKVKIGEAGETEVAYGEKIQKPADPTKESTVSTVYTFDGWYNGETKWNFETDTVSGDVALIAKYTESDRKYNVTIVFVGTEQDREIIEAKYNEKIGFANLAKDGYKLKITVGEDEITELTVTGDVTVTATYTKIIPEESTSESASESTSATESTSSSESTSASGSDGKEESATGGCLSAVGFAPVACLGLLACAFVFKKKKD